MIKSCFILGVLATCLLLAEEYFNYYPVGIGTYWEYTDGSTYEITGNKALQNGKIAKTLKTKCLSCDWSEGEEYIFTDGNVLYITPKVDAEPKFCLLKFPVTVGDYWVNEQNEEIMDTCYVVSKTDDITVPAGVFNDCVKVETRNNGLLYTEWYAIHTGIVKRLSTENNGLMELKSYNIVE